MRNLFFNDFNQLANRLLLRNISKEQLINIKKELEKQKELIKNINQLRERKNKLSLGKESASIVTSLKEDLKIKEQELKQLSEKLKESIAQLPNLPALGIPRENKIIREVKYEHFINHNYNYEKIAQKLNIIDEEASIKLSGSKFVVYQELGTQLIHSLINFMLNEQKKQGYKLLTVPYLVKESNLYNTGQLPKFKEDIFKIKNGDLYLIPTAEVSLVNLYQNQIIKEEDLPLKLCSYSPCFRAEAGSAGQENKGLIRLHQFHKVELVRIVSPEDSYQHLEEIVKDAQNILHLLKIPHRVIELSNQELGFSAAKTYDIEI